LLHRTTTFKKQFLTHFVDLYVSERRAQALWMVPSDNSSESFVVYYSSLIAKDEDTWVGRVHDLGRGASQF
ncbi:hypothetical protein KCU59_g37, partial [Aureobasidium melanogenum]